MIEEILRELYKAPVEFRWALASSGLRKIMTGEAWGVSPFGQRGQLIRRLVEFAGVFGRVRLVVAVVAASEVIRLMYLARRLPHVVLPESCRIFVGFGAGAEGRMWHAFAAESGGPAIRLDEMRPETFLEYHRPQKRTLFRHIWSASSALVPFLSKTALEPVASNRKDTLTYAALKMGKYILYRTWWQEIEQASISQVVFISAETPAFACIDAGMAAVEYRQHGLHRKSILMPAFSTLKMITQVEADWYRQFLPQSRIEVLRPKHRLAQHRPRILVASIYEVPRVSKKQDLVRVQSLVRWAKQNNLGVIIRKHPRETDDFWPTYFPELEIDASQDLFEDAMVRIKPMFVVSWFSTSLVDALLANVVAVSIMQATDSRITDMVFEIPKHCLLWPIGAPVMNALVNGQTDVDSVVSGLLESRPDHSERAALM